MAYGRSYDLPFVISRGNNVYGPGQYPEKAIPKFSILASTGKTISIHGDGLATRSYMHVNDAATAFDIILHCGRTSHIYNIGAHEERTVLSVAQDVCKLVDRDPEEAITHVRDRAFNDRRYFIDCSKLHDLGWNQEVPWEQGLEETVQWYRTQDLLLYWNNFAPALQPHPTATGSSLSFSREQSVPSLTLIEDQVNEASNVTFLIYGRTGWIGGMLGQLLGEGNYRYFYGSARLHDRQDIEADIMRCKPTHILNAANHRAPKRGLVRISQARSRANQCSWYTQSHRHRALERSSRHKFCYRLYILIRC